ncbi:probable tyrosyl-DNA phosphodiesterase isoform X2 [Phlebotomus argentipes]|uniref:probable tyrosyl-DNA phosphodiesterase isoform X2 n=1 Tax=Phlebotomus argentipes TaxID=94469 RepID=UPI00289314E6|nr:probable tyrosyl-DNA phosphodiesterase isoform X2 [Phlebotomus argentipes]
MDNNSTKRSNDLPKKYCQYGKNCYRKNPSHFEEYNHVHLENIIRSADGGNYNVPEEFSLAKDLILEQIAIILSIFPHLSMQPQTKVQKMEEKQVEKRPDSYSEAGGSSKAIPKDLESRSEKNIHDYIKVVLPKGKMEEKLRAAAPYNFFLTAITDSPATHTHPQTITFQEILDKSLGELECSLQINFMVDVGWLLGHYYFAGYDINKSRPNVEAMKVQMATPFGTHHTKMMLLGYADGSMRVVISTANLYEDDWHNRTQGLWMSPKLSAIPVSSDTAFGESPTGFREDLLRYLMAYNIPKVQKWITRVRKSNFSEVNVFLVASVPGGHRSTPKGPLWGHPRVGHLLAQHSARIDESRPIVAQSSSIGSLGTNVDAWVLGEWGVNFRKDSAPAALRRMPQFKMIYPSFNNVKNSHDDLLGGGCLPYGRASNEKQPWLKNHLNQWKASKCHRSQAMPHIKTYCRWSDRGLFWFLLTSANLSKAAWGLFNKSSKFEAPLRISNYEAGVLFLPKFITQEETFPLDSTSPGKVFSMPYDIPLTPYGLDDSPFLMDYLHEALK